MLRAKCVFETVNDINNCVTELKAKATEKGYQLTEIDNRFIG